MKEWTDERISKRRSYQVDVVHASLVVGISLAARGRLAGPKLRPDLFDAKNFILSNDFFIYSEVFQTVFAMLKISFYQLIFSIYLEDFQTLFLNVFVILKV